MNYLLDKKKKERRVWRIVLGALVLGLAIYFNKSIFNGTSSAALRVFRPVLVLGRNIGANFSSVTSFFASKKALTLENAELKADLETQEANTANYRIILDENTKMKEMLGRKAESANLVLSAILSKPNLSPYDTLLIDIGSDHGIIEGDTVFALGNIPIGRVAMVYSNTSKVTLFSNPGEKTSVIVSGQSAAMQIIAAAAEISR